MTNPTKSQVLRAQYEAWPYPHVPLLASLPSTHPFELNAAWLWDRCGSGPAPAKPRIWIAGCGTFQPYAFAVANPTAEIVATSYGQDDWYLQAAAYPVPEFYYWTLGDGTKAHEKEVYHSYLDLDEHWVHLTTVSIHGCKAVDSLLLRPPAHLYFPNAFTPDGDGVNDLFGPVGHYIEHFEMHIFDRWGEEVYRTEDFDKPWDGTVNGGGIAGSGVYVYKYKADGHLFPSVEAYGHVTLVR